jgi:membrane protein implicated in regulation of membrane protease activity
MSEDTTLIALVAAVWVALAALYALVPLFHMPGSAAVWGAGGLIFLVLAALAAAAEAKARRRRDRQPPQAAGS